MFSSISWLMEIIDISFHTSKESATQEAIYIADTIYYKPLIFNFISCILIA